MDTDAVIFGANDLEGKPFLFVNVGLEEVNRYLEKR
jgi:hypothetical protein